MAGEQDMQRMGGLKKYMPVTFVTMMFGTLAIAGIPPMSGFFSKDWISSRAFAEDRLLWGMALATALLTGCYMFRLMALTFYGSYRGPAWARTASPAAAAVAAAHGAPHPLDAHAHGQAQREDHEVTHGAADVTGVPDAWPGPHESSGAMSGVLMALAVGAIVAGFIGIPHALGGTNAIDRFLEPSFAPPGASVRPDAVSVHLSRAAELGSMFLSVLVAAAGLFVARHLYVSRPEAASQLAARWPGLHAVLLNKYYVDELYHAIAVRGTLTSARRLWTFDRRIVDGLVNASGWLTRIASWCAHMFDKHVLDGLVNSLGWSARRGSLFTRRAQTGLVQNYALLMIAGVVAFLTVYLLAR
jgi:NADH-quinone oxidoreductase subunit L